MRPVAAGLTRRESSVIVFSLWAEGKETREIALLSELRQFLLLRFSFPFRCLLQQAARSAVNSSTRSALPKSFSSPKPHRTPMASAGRAPRYVHGCVADHHRLTGGDVQQGGAQHRLGMRFDPVGAVRADDSLEATGQPWWSM